VKAKFLVGGKEQTVDLSRADSGIKGLVGDNIYEFTVSSTAFQEFELKLKDGTKHQVVWVKAGRKIWLHFDGRSYYVEKQAGSTVAGSLAASGERVLRAPMPGQVRQVLVQDGQTVNTGETLVLLEAMKMEIRIQSPGDGKVARVAVKQGQSVEKEQVLVELEA
jgi:biotin carboxyl carrier protein